MTPDEAYEILSLREGSSLEDIRKAQRRLLLKVHPDRHPKVSETEKAALLRRCQAINAAADLLIKKAPWEFDDASYEDDADELLEPELILMSIEKVRFSDWETVLILSRELVQFTGYEYQANIYRSEAFYSLSRSQEAIAAAHVASRFRPHEHLPHYLLSLAYRKIGDEGLALKHIDIAISISDEVPSDYWDLLQKLTESRNPSPIPRPRPVSDRPIRSVYSPNWARYDLLTFVWRPPPFWLGIGLSMLAGGAGVIGVTVQMSGLQTGPGYLYVLAIIAAVFAGRSIFSYRLEYAKATVARTVALAIISGSALSVGFTAFVSHYVRLGVVLVCSPKTGPGVMRVRDGLEAGKDCHETQATHTRTDHRPAA